MKRVRWYAADSSLKSLAESCHRFRDGPFKVAGIRQKHKLSMCLWNVVDGEISTPSCFYLFMEYLYGCDPTGGNWGGSSVGRGQGCPALLLLDDGHLECCDFCKISRCWTSSKLGAVSAVRELMLRCYIIYICSCLMRELQDVIFSTSQVSAVSCEMSLPMTNQNEAAGDGMIQPQWYAECELHASWVAKAAASLIAGKNVEIKY